MTPDHTDFDGDLQEFERVMGETLRKEKQARDDNWKTLGECAARVIANIQHRDAAE